MPINRRVASILKAAFLIGALLLLTTLNAQEARATGTPLVVQLRLDSRVNHRIITIGDVAEITGGDADLRDFIRALDLDEFSDEHEQQSVTKLQLHIRIRMERINADTFQVTGPSKGRVTLNLDPITDQRVVDAIRTSLAEQWHLPLDKVSLRLTSPLPNHTLPAGYKVTADRPLRITPFLATRHVPGPMSMKIGVYENEKLISTFIVSADATIVRPVAIAIHQLQPGDPLTHDDVLFEMRELSGPSAINLASYEDIDRFANRIIPAGKVIDRDSLADTALPTSISTRQPPASPGANAHPASRKTELGPKVNANTMVTIVYRSRSLTLTCHNAKLTRTAYVGERVQVRNMDSNQIVAGNLVSPSEVEVIR